jgi:hypothetical protein
MARLLFLVYFSSCLMISYSQDHYNKEAIEPIGESKFAIGTKGSYGHSFLFPYKNYVYHPSWSVGVTTMYSVTEHLAIALDLLFSSEGATFRFNDYTARYHFDYLRFPLKLVYIFRKYEKDFRPHLALGPSYGYLLNSSSYSNYAKVDLGFNASAGFNYRLLRGFWLTMNAGYYQGFIDINSDRSYNEKNGNMRLEAGLIVGF